MKGSWLLALVVAVVAVGVVSGKTHVKEEHYSESGEHNAAYDHQSILGSKDEEEEFANLSPEEAKKRLSVIFDKMDSDKSQFLVKNEITQWILKSYVDMDVDEAKSSLQDYDKDKDGKVTWNEYSTRMQGDEPDKQKVDESLMETLETDKLKFDAADLDKDGALSLKEYAAFLYPYDFEHMHDVEIDMTLKQMDSDKDGTINFNEFMGDVSSSDERDQIANKENFAEYDKDKDGKLDRQEMAAWIVPSNDESASDEASHLIEETDRNSDGKLTREEVLEKQELWVGSAATSYGKGLHDEL